MKQLLPFFLFIFISFQTMSQSIVVEPNPYVGTFQVDFSGNSPEAVAHSTMTNKFSETKRIKWVIIPDDSCPLAWQYLVCDTNNCYTTAVISNQGGPINNPVTLEPDGHSRLDLHIKPNGKTGCCKPKIEIRDYDDPSIFYETATYEVCIEGVTAVSERQKANLKVYPNPTANYISLSENNFVDQLWISNILGKRVRTFRTSGSNNYDVSTLPDGIYLVSMVDEDHKVLKTVRISKRSIRP